MENNDSEGLADFIRKGNRSLKRIVFLIGGAYGLDEVILKRADFTWSLSATDFSSPTGAVAVGRTGLQGMHHPEE